MQKKRSIKIIAVVMILVLICVSITYVKTGNKEVLATTQEFKAERLQDNEHMHVETDNSGDKVPVPNGYVGSKATGENEIDTGYVIYEGTEEVDDSNVEEAQKTRNQYVWVPVPDATTMYGTDANGKKWGKLYDFTTDTGDGIDPVTGAKPLNWSESNGVMSIINKSRYIEPYVKIRKLDNAYDIDSEIKNLNKELKTTHEFLIQLEKQFNEMIESIENYGGFYIGRYETGDLNQEKAVIRKGNLNINRQTWYTMYSKCKNLSDRNTNIETGMIYGSQWDRTLMWLIESGNKTKEQICNDATDYGNYCNSEFEYRDNSGKINKKNSGQFLMIPTGSAENTKTNNIFDLAGNLNEFTIEESLDGSRVPRGGSYGLYGYSNPYTNRLIQSPILLDNGRRLPSNVIYKIN